MKIEQISVSNNIYYDLFNYTDIFDLQMNLINYAKCKLLQGEELIDFIINDYHVIVNKTKNGYDLYSNNYVLNIIVDDKIIIDFSLFSL